MFLRNKLLDFKNGINDCGEDERKQNIVHMARENKGN